MSELATTLNGKYFRWRLLATSSSLALLCNIVAAEASDARPTVWIELGGQLERVDGGQAGYAPPFVSAIESADTICSLTRETCGESAGFSSPTALQKAPRYSNGGEAKFTFEPTETDWQISVALRYGRSNNSRRVHQETNKSVYSAFLAYIYPGPIPNYFLPSTHKFFDLSVQNRESHSLLDFQVGRDVGVGIFGRHGTSVVSLGVRFAQFSSRSDVAMKADPDLYYPGGRFKYSRHRHTYQASAHIEHSFWAVGPSISWNASAPFAGDPTDKSVSLDWGANAAILFGRQKVSGSGHTTTTYLHMPAFNIFPDQSVTTFHTSPIARSRSVVIPNVGGFAGVSLNFPNAKVGVGYRADFFFGAVDGGVDARKAFDRDFYGPFATIRIGLGG